MTATGYFQPDRSIYVTRPLARRRLDRRVEAIIAYIDEHPETNRRTDPALRRLDDLVGEADRLWKSLP